MDGSDDPASVGRHRQKSMATRDKVLAAARRLFDAQGYEGTTIRQIAAAAGVAVGSVFTAYASKDEILSAVMHARLERLYEALDRVTPHLRGSTADRLRTIFAIHYEFEAQHVRLFLLHIAAAYDWTASAAARPYGRNPHLREMLREVLLAGVARGEVRPEVDLAEVVELLLAAYAWTYRLVSSEAASTAALVAAMDRHIGLIAEGFQVRV